MAGTNFTCALDDAGDVTDWGVEAASDPEFDPPGYFGQTVVPPDLGVVTELAAGALHVCALEQRGTVRCWGYDQYGQFDVH